MALSLEHINKHCTEWTARYMRLGDHGGGGHAGMTLNIFAGLLREPPERIAEAIKDSMVPGD